MGISLSAVKEYLSGPVTTQFGGQTIIDAKRIAAKTVKDALVSTGIFTLLCGILGTPRSEFAPAILFGAAVGIGANCYIMVSSAETDIKADAYIRANVVTSQAMREVIQSPSLFNAILAKAKKDPSILLKKNEKGGMLLTEFVRNSDLYKYEPGLIGMLSYAAYSYVNAQTSENQDNLKKLFFAADWPLSEFLHFSIMLSIKAPDLLESWPGAKEK